MERKKKKINWLYIVVSIIFGLYAISLIFPFYYIINNSFKTNGEFINNVWSLPNKLFAEKDVFRNYAVALEENGVIAMLINSAVLTIGGTILGTLSPVVTSYILAKYNFKLNSAIFTLAVVFMVIPNIGTTVATYRLFVNLQLLNTYEGVLMLYAGPFGSLFLLLYGYFKGISWSYAEAAKIDGAGNFCIFFNIMLPQALPGISAVALLTGINVWNDYFTPYMYMPEAPTISTGIQNMSFNASSTGHYTELFAAMIISLIPVIIVFLLTQKVLMNNVMAGGLKG